MTNKEEELIRKIKLKYTDKLGFDMFKMYIVTSSTPEEEKRRRFLLLKIPLQAKWGYF
jgi:hypothetical protein